MQKDEEVGKVAQATPIVICASIYYYFLQTRSILKLHFAGTTAKALELFLALLIEESGKVTVDRDSKKIEAYHL